MKGIDVDEDAIEEYLVNQQFTELRNVLNTDSTHEFRAESACLYEFYKNLRKEIYED